MMKAVATKRFYCGGWVCPEGFPSDGHSREELLTQMNRSLNLLIFLASNRAAPHQKFRTCFSTYFLLGLRMEMDRVQLLLSIFAITTFEGRLLYKEIAIVACIGLRREGQDWELISN